MIFRQRILGLGRIGVLITAALTLAGVGLPSARAATTQSIDRWVVCGSKADQTAGVVQAFAAARNNAFTLVVDCPVHLDSWSIIDRSIFIDDGTTVEFTGAGKFFVNNLFHPAFVIANSSHIALTGWNVEWDGSLPVNPDVGGYGLGNHFYPTPGTAQPAVAFNNLVLPNWFTANRGVDFDQSKGFVKTLWAGPADLSAVFYITGSSSNVTVSGLTLYAPAGAGASEFVPVAVALSVNWLSRQTVDATTPVTAKYAAVPYGITFSNVKLDGVLMGWQGNLQNSVFENITAARYADLQAADGSHVGGVGKWFPPPHLFYLNYAYDGDPRLANARVSLTNITDYGVRIGTARDKGGNDPGSGYASSLKLGCNGCEVTNYQSHRPDGFMELLPSTGLTVSTVSAWFNSAFLNNLYPPGLRFNLSGFSNLIFEDVHLIDQAPSTVQPPIGNAYSRTNAGFLFADVTSQMTAWAGRGLPLPTINGQAHDIVLAFNTTSASHALRISQSIHDSIAATLVATPATLTHGESTQLTWTSSGASGCSASGAWAGSLGADGSKVLPLATAGNYEFGLDCSASSFTTSAAVPVTAR